MLTGGGGPTNPMTSSPRAARASDPAVSAASVSAARAARTLTRKASPAGVRTTPRGWRSRSSIPSSASSWETAWDSTGWAIPSRLAARVICPSSATATR